jgi:hypothetical protein
MLYASDLLYITATFSARTAVLCLIHALSPEYWHTLFTRCCIALSILVSVAGVLMIAFGCNAKAPWSQIVNECGSIVSHFLFRCKGNLHVADCMDISTNVGSLSPCLKLPWNWPSSASPYGCSSTYKGDGVANSKPQWSLHYDCRMSHCPPSGTLLSLHVTSQHHDHRNLQTPLPARLSLIHGPLPRPCAPDSMDTGRASVQLRDGNHTLSHALFDETEHRPWSALTRGLCQGDDEARVERELCAAVIEAVAVAKSQHGKCTADMRHLNHVS